MGEEEEEEIHLTCLILRKGSGTTILTFLGGFHPQTQSLWLTDIAHHRGDGHRRRIFASSRRICEWWRSRIGNGRITECSAEENSSGNCQGKCDIGMFDGARRWNSTI